MPQSLRTLFPGHHLGDRAGSGLSHPASAQSPIWLALGSHLCEGKVLIAPALMAGMAFARRELRRTPTVPAGSEV